MIRWLSSSLGNRALALVMAGGFLAVLVAVFGAV
jgi:hypothetical protein